MLTTASVTCIKHRRTFAKLSAFHCCGQTRLSPMKRLCASILCLLLVIPPAWGADIALQVGRHSVHAEIADTPDSRTAGLMQRDHLCANCGMLFVFPSPGRYTFWMKNTVLPLSIAFISADGKILNIAEMHPNDASELHGPDGDVLYSLEMNKGWFAKHGIRAGDRVHGLEHAPAGR